jgi:hypothetical protein
MTINVEYNQLDPLLKATGNGQGDVNNEEGWSPYPGETGCCSCLMVLQHGMASEQIGA